MRLDLMTGAAALAFFGCGGPAAEPRTASPAPTAELDCSVRTFSEFGDVAVAPRGARRDADAERFSELDTSAQQPIEVCGLEGQLAVLRRLRCDDGSNPFDSVEAAHDARVAVNQGGRCGMPVDVYEVPCPEARYQVHLDLYVCLVDELDGRAPEPALYTFPGTTTLVPGGWHPAGIVREPPEVVLVTKQGDRLVIAAERPGDGDLRARLAEALEVPAGVLPMPGEQDDVAEATQGGRLRIVARGPRTDQGARWHVALDAAAAGLGARQARELLPRLLAEARSNEHEYREYASLAVAPDEATELGLQGETVDGREYFYPRGWQAALSGTTLTARKPTGSGELRFVRYEVALDPEKPDEFLLATAMGSLVGTGDDTTLVSLEFVGPSDHRMVVDERDHRRIIASRFVGGHYLQYMLLGAAEDIRAQRGVLLLEALIYAYERSRTGAATAEP